MKAFHSIKQYRLTEFIFYSNYFYGICAVALSLEASLQQHYPLNKFYYYFLVFVSVVLYYTHPYARKKKPLSNNPRTRWYNRHYFFIYSTQIIFTVILLAALAIFLYYHTSITTNLSLLYWILIIIFPAAGICYYGINILSVKYTLRETGWLKPFIIGFTWAGFVTIYPVLFYCLTHNLTYKIHLTNMMLFFKNMFFVAVLCIMFDIKDYASDATYNIRTFVVKIGIRKTIFFVLLPLSLLGLTTFMIYAVTRHFHTGKILLNSIPFLLLIAACFSLEKRRSLLYYLIIIDGLMLVKAVCGSIAEFFFNS